MINSNSFAYTWKWAANCSDTNFTEALLKDNDESAIMTNKTLTDAEKKEKDAEKKEKDAKNFVINLEKMVSHLSFDCKSSTPDLKTNLDEVFEKIAKLPLDQEISRKAIRRLFKSVIVFEGDYHYHLGSLLGLYLRCIYESHNKLARTISTLMISSHDEVAVSSASSKRSENRKIIRYTQKDDEKLLMMLCEKPVEKTKKDEKLKQILQLIQDGADVNTKDPLGFTPLHIACVKGYLDVVNALLGIPNIVINAKNLRGETPLILAAYFNEEEICKTLIASKASLEIATTNGWTAFLAAVSKGNLSIVELLTSAGANVFKVDIDVKNAVQTALSNNNIKVIEYLLSIGVSMNLATELEFTMMKHPAPSVEVDLVLKKDLSQINDTQRANLLHLAVEYRYFSPFKALYKPNAEKDLDYLIDAKLKLSNVIEDLKAASITKKVQREKKFKFFSSIISFLESQGVNIDQKEDGKSRLLQEVEKISIDFERIKNLLSMGADVDTFEDGTIETALMKAVQRHFLSLVKFLVENKASLDLMDASGKTALMHAQELEYPKIETYLIQKGATF